MSLGLKAADYLTMLNDEYAEYKAQPLSMRKAINCCALANSLPEIVYAQYGSSNPLKVHNTTSQYAYRDYLRTQSEAHHTVRDLCDFSKHAVLDRKSVNVRTAAQQKRLEGFFQGLLALTTTREVERLIVTFRDGTEKIIDEILNEAVTSWNAIFSRDGLSA